MSDLLQILSFLAIKVLRKPVSGAALYDSMHCCSDPANVLCNVTHDHSYAKRQ